MFIRELCAVGVILFAVFQGGRCCFNGYYGTDCTNICDARCLTCSNSYSCDSCPSGAYGSLCQNPCPDECLSCSSDSCITCKPGHAGPDKYCWTECPNTCSTCTTASTCGSCKTGLNCSGVVISCSQGCQSCDSGGHCLACEPGFWGEDCKGRCAYGCNGTCNQTDGWCQCKPNFTGYRCTECVPGMYGTNCLNSCPYQCDTCVVRHVSSGLNYECKVCNSGFHGSNCLLNCSVGCVAKECDPTTGACSRGCELGFAGSHCCSSKCSWCYKTGACSFCSSGFYGSLCENSCPANCLADMCDLTSGDCSYCDSGFYGSRCEKTCPENCNLYCDFVTGGCGGVCNRGFYGTYCENSCPGCTSGCDNTGICTTNYLGDLCHQGFYGSRCDTACDVQCKGGVCHQTSGVCINGCNDGYSSDGSRCKGNPTVKPTESTFPGEEPSPKSKGGLVGGIVGGVTVVIVVIVGLVFVIVQKRRKRLCWATPSKPNATDYQSPVPHVGVINPCTGYINPRAQTESVYQEVDYQSGYIEGRISDQDTISDAATTREQYINAQGIGNSLVNTPTEYANEEIYHIIEDSNVEDGDGYMQPVGSVRNNRTPDVPN